MASINATTSSGIVATADNTATLQLQTAGVNAINIDASQNVGIGTTSPVNLSGQKSVTINASGVARTDYQISGTTQGFVLAESGYLGIYTPSTQYLSLGTTDTERMRIDSSGNVLIGMSGVAATGARMDVAQQTNSAVTVASFDARQATSGNQYGIFNRLNGDPNNTVNYFFRCNGGANERATIRSNGGLANFSANNVNLASDYRLKNTIEPVKDYWNTFKNIEWKTWLYNDQTDDIKNIGVIAQELQTLAPELVCESNAVETPEDESPYLGIWENDFKMAGLSVITQLIKKTEEQQTIINDLKARIEALEAK